MLTILEVVGGWPVAMDKWNKSVGKAGQVALGLGLLGAEAF